MPIQSLTVNYNIQSLCVWKDFELALYPDICIQSYGISRLGRASHIKMIQWSTLRPGLRLCHFKISLDTSAFRFYLAIKSKALQKKNLEKKNHWKENQGACRRQRENTGNGNFLAQNLNLSRDLFKKEKDYCSSFNQQQLNSCTDF